MTELLQPRSETPRSSIRGRKPDVGIVGGGVVGLNTGIEALRAGYTAVTIYEKAPYKPQLARRPQEQPVSARASEAAIAQWYPYVEGGVTKDSQATSWIKDSLTRYFERESTQTYKGSLRRLPNTELLPPHDAEPMPDYLRETLERFGKGSVREIVLPENPLGYTDAYDFTTFAINTPSMLTGLSEEFTGRGGKIVSREVGSQDEIEDLPQRVIVNAMGLAARDIFPELGLKAVKGHILFYRNPGIERIVSAEDSIILPRSPEILAVGAGYWHEGEYATKQPTAAERALLEDKAVKMAATDIGELRGISERLRDAQFLGETTGFRPYRKEGILVASDERASGKVLVHNIGHGGMGWTVAPGTAKAAVKLLDEQFA